MQLGSNFQHFRVNRVWNIIGANFCGRRYKSLIEIQAVFEHKASYKLYIHVLFRFLYICNTSEFLRDSSHGSNFRDYKNWSGIILCILQSHRMKWTEPILADMRINILEDLYDGLNKIMSIIAHSFILETCVTWISFIFPEN